MVIGQASPSGICAPILILILTPFLAFTPSARSTAAMAFDMIGLAAFQAFMTRHLNNCPVCKSEDMTAALCGPLRFTEPTADPPSEQQRHLMALTCDGCGRVEFFDASHAGWTDD
jgi:hypothetical protein